MHQSFVVQKHKQNLSCAARICTDPPDKSSARLGGGKGGAVTHNLLGLWSFKIYRYLLVDFADLDTFGLSYASCYPLFTIHTLTCISSCVSSDHLWSGLNSQLSLRLQWIKCIVVCDQGTISSSQHSGRNWQKKKQLYIKHLSTLLEGSNNNNFVMENVSQSV